MPSNFSVSKEPTDIERRPERQIRAFVASVIVHTIAFGLLIPSKPPTTTAAGSRRAQIARPRVPADARTPAAPDSGRQASGTSDASKPLIPIKSTDLPIPGFKFDIGKIASRASALFPFLDLELKIPVGPMARFRDDASPRGHGMVFVHAAAGQPGDGLPRLRLSNNAFQAIVDVTWSRRSRWNSFKPIRTLTGQYTGEEGALPNLLRAYVDANSLQPFYDTTIRDPRLWAELDIAADHVDFIQFVVDYAVRHPSIRATTELLFLLDKLTQANFDALTTLLDTNPHDLRWTVEANRDAYMLIRAIRVFYLERLGGLATNRAALRGRYEATRLQILRSIIRTTPEEYRANDARFLIGAIAWRAGEREAALRAWQELQIRQTDYYAASASYVLDVLKQDHPGGILSPAAAARITAILDNEDARWLAFSTARLKRFGYTLDSF